MAEYIEREALMSIIKGHHYLLKSSSNTVDYGMFTIGINQAVDECPAADVEPVRRGHWIINSDGYYPQCSECMNEPQSRVMTDWSPNCGAKMGGE